MAYLPSKKFIIVALAVLLAGVGGFWFYKKGGIENNPLFPKDKSSLSLNFGQGEKNWEEVLWEIASSSPNINPKMFAEKDSSGETEGLTKTDILARDFIFSYLALKQSGNLSPENKQKLTESFLAGIEQEKLPDKYKLSDIKIIDDNSNTAFKKYGNELAKIIKKYNSTRSESEISIIYRALKEQDESQLQKLALIIVIYQDTAEDLLKMEAPRDLAQYHLNILNGMFNISQTISKIQEEMFKDPINGIIGVRQYQEEYVKIDEAFKNISRYFSKQGIFFNKNEDGYSVFVNNRE